MKIREFMDKARSEEYDPKKIYSVWAELPQELIENNEKCGVCPVGYTKHKQSFLICDYLIINTHYVWYLKGENNYAL